MPEQPAAISLRPAGPEDAGFLFRVFASTREEELAPLSWGPDEVQAFLRQQFEAQDRHYRTHFADAEYAIVLCAGEPVGRWYVFRDASEIRILDVALLPAARDRGIGGLLLRGLLEEAAAARRPVRLHVEQQNRARRLYERLGFRPAAQVGIYCLMEWLPAAPGEVPAEAAQLNTAS